MIKALLDFIFDKIFGIKSQEKKDKETIKNMSEVELNEYLKTLESQVNKDTK